MTRRRHLLTTRKQHVKKRGSGLLNTLINHSPEIHAPGGYNFCGPGTKLSKRLQRGDKGVNPLDEACKVHDTAYTEFKDVERRNIADKELAKAAWKRVKASDASLGEKLTALGVTGVMKLKSKLGMGLKRKKTTKSKKRGGKLNIKVERKARKYRKPRIIPIPKKGGIIPILPMLAALGALGGGAAGIAKAVNDAKSNRKALAEQQRHNRVMETVIKGNGLYMKPYKTKGKGLFSKN